MSIRELHRPSTLARRESVLIGSQAVPVELEIPANTIGIVVLAEASERGQRSTRNLFVAQVLRSYGLGTLLFDLLTEPETLDHHPVFDIPLLGARVTEALLWLRQRTDLADIPIGLFGTRTVAAAALLAAAGAPAQVGAVVSCGGRPDLAGAHLTRVRAPTLLIVGGEDSAVLEFNRLALRAIPCTKKLEVVPGATHLFDQPGTLDVAAGLAGHWFEQHLPHQELS